MSSLISALTVHQPSSAAFSILAFSVCPIDFMILFGHGTKSGFDPI